MGRGDRLRRVKIVGRADVDDVDIGICQERFQRRMRALQAAILRELRPPLTGG